MRKLNEKELIAVSGGLFGNFFNRFGPKESGDISPLPGMGNSGDITPLPGKKLGNAVASFAKNFFSFF